MSITAVGAGSLIRLPRTTDGRRSDASAQTQASGGDNATASANITQQSPAVQAQVAKLQQSDTSVRQHEAAHQAAGGGFAGGASFEYQRGPDGKTYAVGGEVPIDISAERDPSATISKMETVKRAALAPADPSPQDVRVAAQADAQKLQAQQELRQQQSGGGPADEGGTDKGGTGGAESGRGGTAAPALAARGTAAYGAAARIGFGQSSGAGLIL